MPWGCLPLFRREAERSDELEDFEFDLSLTVARGIPAQLSRKNSNVASSVSTRSSNAMSEFSRASVSFSSNVEEVVYFGKYDPPKRVGETKPERSRSFMMVSSNSFPPGTRIERRHLFASSLE